MVRSPDKVGNLVPDSVELVQGDFDDRESLKRALENVDRAFLLTPSSARAVEQQLSFVEAAKGCVRHLVKLSQFAADPTSPVRFLRYHAAVEAAIRDSNMAWTFLRPNLYMQGFSPSPEQSRGMASCPPRPAMPGLASSMCVTTPRQPPLRLRAPDTRDRSTR